MIIADQPTLFGKRLTVRLSSKSDGTMKFDDRHDEAVKRNQVAFLAQFGSRIEQSAYLHITYDTTDFTRYQVMTELPSSPNKWSVDGLATAVSGAVILLPIADCAGLVVYDPDHHVVMLSHVGRQAVEQNGAYETVRFMQTSCASRPNRLLVWSSPMVGGYSYPIYALNNCSLRDSIYEQLTQAGVKPANYESCGVDTAMSSDYFSHSQYQKGHRDSDGRFAVAVQLI